MGIDTPERKFSQTVMIGICVYYSIATDRSAPVLTIYVTSAADLVGPNTRVLDHFHNFKAKWCEDACLIHKDRNRCQTNTIARRISY